MKKAVRRCIFNAMLLTVPGFAWSAPLLASPPISPAPVTKSELPVPMLIDVSPPATVADIKPAYPSGTGMHGTVAAKPAAASPAQIPVAAFSAMEPSAAAPSTLQPAAPPVAYPTGFLDTSSLPISKAAPIVVSESPKETPAFHDMLVYVYQQNPRLKSARYALRAEDEKVAEAVAGFRPTLSANGDIGRQREQTGGQNWIYGTARDESLVVNQPLFNGHGTFAQFHAARARVSAQRAHLITVEEQVFLDAITAYLDVITRQQILEYTRENRLHLQSYVDATGKRLKAGDSTKTDLAQAESRSAQADAGVANAEAGWIAANATYQRATALQMTSTRFPDLPEGLPESAEDAIALAKKAPEFTEAAEQERAASHDIDVAASNLWPTVSLRGSTTSQLTPSLGLQNLRNDSVTVNVSIPLYQGGGEYARIREARELREKAREDLVDTSRFMTERASQAWHNYDAAHLVINASRKTTDAADHALHGIEAEHQQGLRTMQDTLDSRAEYLNSLIAQAQAEQNLHLQAYRLMAATGQLTAIALQLDTPIYNPREHYDRVEHKWAGTSSVIPAVSLSDTPQ